ncbi:MAG: tyrosine-type recombinase/integrase [Candidatus Woesearchaeota archaeon]
MAGELVQQVKETKEHSILSGFAGAISSLAYNTQKAYLTDLVVFFREMFPEHWRFHQKFNPVALDVALQYVINEFEEQAKLLPEIKEKYENTLPAIKQTAAAIKHRCGLMPIIRQEGELLYMNLNPIPDDDLEELIDVDKKDIDLVQAVFRQNIEYMGKEFFSHIFNVEAIGNVLGHLKRYHGNSDNTINRKIASLKQFELYLENIGLVDRIMMHKVPRPRYKHNAQQYVEYEDVAKLVKSVEDTRDRAILSILFGLGIRASELCDLKPEDDCGDEMIIRKGKGGKKRIQIIPENARKALDDYMSKRANLYPEIQQNYLFLSKSGRQLRREDIFRMLRKYAKLEGLSRKINPHSIRRTVASKMDEEGGSITGTQDFLGHSSPNTTVIYIGNPKSKKIKFLKKYHPEG